MNKEKSNIDEFMSCKDILTIKDIKIKEENDNYKNIAMNKNSSEISIRNIEKDSKPQSPNKTLYNKKDTLFLPDILEEVENIKKQSISKTAQLASEKLRMTLNKIKSKITTAFLNNEEEESLKKHKFI